MASVKIPHVDHPTICRSWKSWKTDHARGRVHVAQLEFTISHSDLEQLKGHSIMCRASEKSVKQRGIYVGNKAVPGTVHVRDIAR